MEAAHLESKLRHEIEARAEAERILEARTRELISANDELMASAEQMFEHAEQLVTILNLSHASIFLVNEHGLIQRTNKAVDDMFLVRRGALVGRPIDDVLRPADGTALANLHARIEANGFRAVETVLCRNDGSDLEVELHIAPFEAGGRERAAWFVRDITTRKQNERERLALEHELQQAHKLESLGTLASGIAHEINTPIQYISDNARFLGDSFADLVAALDLYDSTLIQLETSRELRTALAEVRRCLDKFDIAYLRKEIPGAIEQSLEGLSQVSHIVGAIKEFAHPGAIELTPTDLNDMVRMTATVTRNQWKYVAHLETNLDETLPLVPCLAGEIKQALLNLIVNAAQAIEEAKRTESGIITVTTRQSDGCAEISVRDSGKGIPAGIRDRIFEPFFTTKGVGKGSGQGLAIVYNSVVNKHGGQILVDSDEGVGSVFTIRLPLVSASVSMEDNR